MHNIVYFTPVFWKQSIFSPLCCLADIVRSDIALDKQKGCKVAHHPDIMLELQREKAATTQLVLLKEQLSNIYSNITITGRRSNTQAGSLGTVLTCSPDSAAHAHAPMKARQCKPSAFRMTNVISGEGMQGMDGGVQLWRLVNSAKTFPLIIVKATMYAEGTLESRVWVGCVLYLL